jgi:hypothetical protein
MRKQSSLEVTGVNPRFGRRSWVKLWVNEWLDGTTRFEMSDAQRAFWIDLLAMAGRSRFPGKICAGQVDGTFVGYPINKFQSLMAEPIDIQETLQLFERTGKVRLTTTSEKPIKLVMIELVNWDRYQSEYQRQKKYRGKLQQSDSQSDTQSNKTETEGEVEGEVEERQRLHPRRLRDAFQLIGCEPFGSQTFQLLWEYEAEHHDGKSSWADAMERVIQQCQKEKPKIKVPGRFYAHKKEVEKIEAQQTYKKTPL